MDPWEIRVHPESERQLSKLDLQRFLANRGVDEAFVDSPYQDGGRVLNRIGDRCVFLSPDCKCQLHREYGPLNKPQTCIDFPFSYVDTPNGTYLGLSFACSAVLENTGEPVETKRDWLEENYTRTGALRGSLERPQLTSTLAIDFDAYLAVEQALMDILSLEFIDLSQRLLTQSIFLDLLIRTFQAAREGGAGDLGLSDRQHREVESATDLDLALRVCDRYQADNWGRLLVQAAKQPYSLALQRALMGMITAFRRALIGRRSRLRTARFIAGSYFGHASRLARIRLEPLEGAFEYERFSAVKLDVSPGSYFDYLLGRYFRHSLFRKDLLLSESVFLAHRFMLMRYALIYWYAVGLCVRQGLGEADHGALREALRNVEKYYVHHSRFTAFLEQAPLLARVTESLLRSPRFPSSMVRPPVESSPP